MGAVYEAHDTERGGRVAIKTLPSANPDAIARFKREFRALQDIRHPNLVTFGELFCEQGTWSFTMDLVEGEDFLSYVLGEWRTVDDASGALALAPTCATAGHPSAVPLSPPPLGEPARRRRPSLDEGRLRAALLQLASALDALHATNKIHRDIKPSNIRIRDDGHLFLLDFGLLVDLESREALTGAMVVIGTPIYMAPEQAASSRVGPEADWYSVGVVLFEALTGRHPFEGAPLQILVAKQKGEAPRASSFESDVAADLDELCARLLSLDPTKRPTGRDVLRALRKGGGSASKVRIARALSTEASTFVGRSDELAQLQGAFRRTRDGSAACVVIEGESGIGKSFLARQFVERLQREDPHVVVLAGRCYERESVPYNAWDGVVDALVQHLLRLASDPAALLPMHVAALVQTFPSLRRVPAINRAIRELSAKMDPLEVRSRAFSALREMFGRIGQRAPLVVLVDDLQWADRDSVGLLAEVLREPEPPALLFVATARPRSEAHQATSNLGDALTRATEYIPITRLSEEQSCELAGELLARAGCDTNGTADAIGREAGGHALFIAELARHVLAHGSQAMSALRLEDVLWTRIAALEEPARRLITILCVAGRPMSQTAMARAAAVKAGALAGVVSDLRVGHLIRTATAEGAEFIDAYHDRVRNAVLAHLTHDERRSAYEELALALDGSKHAEPHILSEFWRAAGDLERGASYARKAGDQASEALAFDRAATFYDLALQRPSCAGEERHRLEVLLADTLAKAGRGARAAALYQRAAKEADPAEALDLERKAADQLLRVGHFDEGLDAMRAVVERVGFRWPKTALETLLTFLWLRLLVTLRGERFRIEHEGNIPARDRSRIDVCLAAATGLGAVDTLRAGVFQLWATRLALRAGESTRVALVLVLEAVNRAAFRGTHWERTRASIARAQALAERVGDPLNLALVSLWSGMAIHVSGRMRSAVEIFHRAITLLSQQATWELTTIYSSLVANLVLLGELKTLVEFQAGQLRIAIDRGDVYGAVTMRVGNANFAWLVQDEPGLALKHVDEAMAQWSVRGFHVLHTMGLGARANVHLYRGAPERALAEIDASWRPLRRSLLLHVQYIRLYCCELRARALLASAERSEPGREHAVRAATRDIHRIAREKMPLAGPFADMLRAGLAAVRGDDARAMVLLRAATETCHAADMNLHATVARRYLGKMLKGSEGAALVEEAETFMRRETVKNIPAMCRCILPGFARFE
jgi:tetratricopeptide (TPR) repeat protein